MSHKFNNDNKFDFDLTFGQDLEYQTKKALEGKVEVKTERDIWRKTGNIAIEYECRGKPSGITVTQAEHWIHCLTDNGKPYMYLIFPMNVIKQAARKNIKRTVMGGDDNQSKMVLIKLRDLF